MSNTLNRREFIKRLLAFSATGAALGLSGCASKPAAAPTPIPPPAATATGTAVPAAATTVPPTSPPAPTATAVPAVATAIPATATAVPATATKIPATPTPAPAAAAYLAVARGAKADPKELVRRAVAALGGIERFVKKGADVIVKPNVCTAYHGPEYASTTNPDVVAAIVQMCLAAGAKRVRVMDFPFGGTPQASYEISGIAAAVKAAGGEMEVMSRMKYRDVEIPDGKRLKKWQVYGDIVDADLVINVPIAKDHSATRLTLGMKNLMGVVYDRNGMHSRGLDQCIADINSVVKPQLTIVDAIRILTANGPTGGSLDDVKRMDTIIASADVVAADAYATSLFGMKPADIGYIKYGAEMGLGKMDLKTVKVEEIAV
ncbi:MAG: DUF362 domain-containing protein [Chloroflexi bacterium]|nr:DUF362 domain-containing protein [Chloroflexota bacterium]